MSDDDGSSLARPGDDVIAYRHENTGLMRLLYAVTAACFVIPVMVYGRTVGRLVLVAPTLLVPALVVGGAALSVLPAVVNKGMDAGERRLELAACAFAWAPSAVIFVIYRLVARGWTLTSSYPALTWTAPIVALAVGLIAIVSTRVR